MKHIEIEITYDSLQEFDGAVAYIRNKLLKEVALSLCEGEIEKPFRVKFSRTDASKLKEPDRIETNEDGKM